MGLVFVYEVDLPPFWAWKPFYSKIKRGLFPIMINSLFFRSYAPLLTLNTNASVLPVLGNGTRAFVSGGCYDRLVLLMLRLLTPRICLPNSLFGNPPIPEL